MWKQRVAALIILFAGFGVGYFIFSSELTENSRFPFKYGLDLAGGTHLVYRADVSELEQSRVSESMDALREIIERRVNLFGVAEPIVQTEKSGILSGVKEERLIVELPGVTNTKEAIELIGKTPLLEFKLLQSEAGGVDEDGTLIVTASYTSTGLTGRLVQRAQLEFGSAYSGQVSNEPIVILYFNNEGAEIFEDITTRNVGEVLGIFLDGELKSQPVIQEPITGGTATISGGFTPEEARTLVRDLNFGALPVPIELLSTQTIGSSLGDDALSKGIVAGILGLLFVSIFLILWYRLPGILSVVSLAIYIAVMLSIFKLIPVTLTAASIAGFILSIGLAVDANVLIFERMKEELKDGKRTKDAATAGFARAWLSIRDGNISSIITAIILFWFGSSLIEGFALTFGIGVMISMLTAILVSRTFIYAIGDYANRGIVRFLFGSGIHF